MFNLRWSMRRETSIGREVLLAGIGLRPLESRTLGERSPPSAHPAVPRTCSCSAADIEPDPAPKDPSRPARAQPRRCSSPGPGPGTAHRRLVQSNVWPSKPAWMAASARTACATHSPRLPWTAGWPCMICRTVPGRRIRAPPDATTGHGTSWRSRPGYDVTRVLA